MTEFTFNVSKDNHLYKENILISIRRLNPTPKIIETEDSENYTVKLLFETDELKNECFKILKDLKVINI